MRILSILDRIVDLMKKQNKKQKDLTDYIGITKNAFTDWKSGRINSYVKYLPQIAEFLNCSVDYLLGRTDEPVSPTDDDLLNLLRENKGQGTIIGFGDGRHIKTDMTYEDFEEIEAMWRALKEKRKK